MGKSYFVRPHSLKYQKTYRITASRLEGILGKSKFSSRAKTVLNMLGLIERDMNPNIEHGIRMEPLACKWYEKEYSVRVQPCEMVFSKKDHFFAAIPDGLVGSEGLLEIKCPQRMYAPLEEYDDDLEPSAKQLYNTELYDQFYSHLFESHYLQMQLEMWIMDRSWCDFVVYTDSEVFIQKIPRDSVYFERILNQVNEEFIPKYLELLDRIGLKLVSLEEGFVKGKIRNSEQAIQEVHDLFVDQCVCDTSETILECCSKQVLN